MSWKQGPCTATTGTNGTCYSSNECTSLGGTASGEAGNNPGQSPQINKTCSGTCASGFGVCCLVTVTCGGTTSVNGTYFQNPGYPSTYNSVSSCRLTINKCTEEVCQLRLDMDNMVLSQPETTDNQCQSDQFIISGGTPVPATCGTLTGSHSKNMELLLINRLTCTITEKAPTRSFTRLKVATNAFTYKTLLRHYAKRALTPRSLNVKLGP